MRPFTVSELTADIGGVLTEAFQDVMVEGEVGGFKAHGSGHWYFNLKDGNAVLACAMFRNANVRVRRPPREGERVVVRGGIDVYPPRGTYSLIVRTLAPAGAGDLARKLEELKAKLAAEGLFDPARKRPLPAFPSVIGVATSATGAAFQDIRRVVRQRWPGLPIVLAPCRVQGDGSAEEIARAIRMLGAHGKADVIIVGRGGGSAEDLWAFNEEVVVRAVAASPIPTVSAVGHEVDVSLCDLAADVRAATPSHAAELVTPVREDLEALVADQYDRLYVAMQGRVQLARERVRRVRLLHPRQRVERGKLRADELDERLRAAMARAMARRRDKVGGVAGRLDALSPLKVLVRGYAIVTRDGAAVRRAGELAVGDVVAVRFAEGRATARVEGVE